MIVLGMGSGTSVDGIDAAALDLTLEGSVLTARVLATSATAYPEELRQLVLGTFPPSRVGIEQVCRVDTAVGQAFATVAADLCDRIPEVDLIASHGQTVFHDVVDGEVRGTLQLGQPSWIAELTGRPVVSDLRVADVAAGGQGAPLASTWDRLWLAGRGEPAAALNLGGIANITVVLPDGDVVASDTGPANALLDAAVRWRTDGQQQVDVDGRLAARGSVDEALLAVLLEEPYYSRQMPKTTGKELFHLPYLQAALARIDHEVDTADLLATLTELTARTVADALRDFDVREVVVSGGGAANPSVLARLAAQLPGLEVVTSRARGLDPDVKEACLFALLGWLTWHGLPGTLPPATGARHPRIAGRITPGHRALVLPEPSSRWPERLELKPA